MASRAGFTQVDSDPNQGDKLGLDITLIGSLRVRDFSGSRIDIRGRKAQGIVAFLVLSPGPVLRDTLVRILWSRVHRDQGRASLRHSIYELQKSLGVVNKQLLISEKHYVALNMRFVRSDIHEINNIALDRPHGLDLITGSLLENLYGVDPVFDEWLQAERKKLESRARSVAERIFVECDTPKSLVAACEYILRYDVYNQNVWRKLLDLYTSQNDEKMASHTYQRYKSIFGGNTNESLSDNINQFKAQHNDESTSPSFLHFESRTESSIVEASKTRFAVLNFQSLDQDSVVFSKGLTQEIVNDLLRFRGLSCLSPSSLQTHVYNHESFSKLSIDFVIDGSIQSGQEKLRINVQLMDVNSYGEIIWSKQFDREYSDILMMQSQVAAQIVAQIDPELLVRGRKSGSYAQQERHTPVQLIQRAIPGILKLERKEFMKSGQILSIAIKEESRNAAAHAWLAYWNLLLLGQGWAENPSVTEELTGELAKRAVALDPEDARALALAGHVQAFTHRRLDEAMALHNRALSINPSLPIAWLFSGLANSYAGLHDVAIRQINYAKHLSPFDPHGFFFDMGLTLALSLRGDDHQAIFHGRNAAEINPSFSSTYKAYLSALGFVGSSDVIRRTLHRLKVLEPGFTVSNALKRSPLSRVEDRQKFGEGLRRSGLSE